MKALELYSGIGGMHYALKTVNQNVEVLLAVDINEIANKVYKYNFPTVNLRTTNIQSLTMEEINKLEPDIILLSPPCQPFTRIGVQKDVRDERSRSLLHIINNLLPYLHTVKYILLENVKGFETSEARRYLLKTLKRCDFKFKEFLLNPQQYNVCNSRLRYYLIGKKKSPADDVDNAHTKSKMAPDEADERIETDIPRGNTNDASTTKVKEILEFNHWDETNRYSLPLSSLVKYHSALDIVGIDSTRTCCFTKAYTRYLQGTGSILSIVDTSDTCRIRQEYSKEVDDNFVGSRLQWRLKPRFFTPTEISRLMCFPTQFSFPSDINDKQRYKLLGNSVNVLVVSKMLHYLITEF